MSTMLLNYGFNSDGLNLNDEKKTNEWDIEVHDSKEIEIEFYDESKQFEENFEDGSSVKYILLPIYKDKNLENRNYTKLLNAGSKVLLNRKKVMDRYSEGFNYFVFDYDSIFGLRLLSFENYNSDFFSCEERVLFETLIIKFHLFKFCEFYYSYEVIRRELGIKKDRARTIINKFISLGFLNCQVKTSSINNRASQISYYNLNANKIIELIPLIYKSEHQNKAEEELTAYLEPAIEKQSKNNSYPIDITSIMQ